MDPKIELTIAPIQQFAVAMENARLNAQRMLAAFQGKIEQAAGVALVFADFEEQIRRSIERWLALQQAAAAQITERMELSMTQMAELMAAAAVGFERYRNEDEPEACKLLSQSGWLGMDRHFCIQHLRESVLLHKTQGEAAMNDAIVDHFNKDDSALLAAMSEEWLNIPYFRDREEIVRDAVDAHKRGKFTLSIPALLPLVDGLAAEVLGIPSMKAVALLAEDLKAQGQEVWAQGFCDFVAHVYYKGYVFGKDTAPYLNRHGILHGRVYDYPSVTNSTRAFLLIDVVADLWREKQKALASPTIQ